MLRPNPIVIFAMALLGTSAPVLAEKPLIIPSDNVCQEMFTVHNTACEVLVYNRCEVVYDIMWRVDISGPNDPVVYLFNASGLDLLGYTYPERDEWMVVNYPPDQPTDIDALLTDGPVHYAREFSSYYDGDFEGMIGEAVRLRRLPEFHELDGYRFAVIEDSFAEAGADPYFMPTSGRTRYYYDERIGVPIMGEEMGENADGKWHSGGKPSRVSRSGSPGYSAMSDSTTCDVPSL